jgi:hypothetical protein
MKNVNESEEALGILPLPATRPAPNSQPDSGLLANIPERQGAPSKNSGANIIETHGKDAHGRPTYSEREITPHETPARIRKPELPSLKEIREEIVQLRADVEQAQTDYEAVNLDEWYAPLKTAEARVAQLRAQLAEAEATLKEAQSAGSPKDSFTSFVVGAETKVASLSRVLFSRYLQDASRATFNIDADRLSAAVKRDLGLQFEDRFRRFTSFTRLHRVERPSEDMVKGNAERVVEALNYLLEESAE